MNKQKYPDLIKSKFLIESANDSFEISPETIKIVDLNK